MGKDRNPGSRALLQSSKVKKRCENVTGAFCEGSQCHGLGLWAVYSVLSLEICDRIKQVSSYRDSLQPVAYKDKARPPKEQESGLCSLSHPCNYQTVGDQEMFFECIKIFNSHFIHQLFDNISTELINIGF